MHSPEFVHNLPSWVNGRQTWFTQAEPKGQRILGVVAGKVQRPNRVVYWSVVAVNATQVPAVAE